MRLTPPNPLLLDRLTPFAVASKPVCARLDLQPFGEAISPDHLFDPLRSDSARFLERLTALDAATFGLGEMAMPRWILLDGAGLSGAIIGLGARVQETSSSVRTLLDIEPGETGLVPYAMFIAIPSFEPDTWVGHNLASLAVRQPEGEMLRGLGSLTKAVALQALGARYQLGAAQWDSVALRVHARLGTLRLLTAWTPAHSKPWTFTYRAQIDEPRLRHLARDPGGSVSTPRPQKWLQSDDHAGMQVLQREIERGEHWSIVGPPVAGRTGVGTVPLARC